MAIKSERPPINKDYLTKSGPPSVFIPAKGIIAIMSGDGYETVDMTFEQFEQLYNRMGTWRES